MTLQFFIAIVCFAVFRLSSSACAAPHQFAGMCDQCHDESGVEARSAGTGFCLACHAIDPDRSHPSLKQPDMPLASGWSTDAQGRIDCVTCHYVCQSERQGVKAQLRGDLPFEQFCRNCHGPSSLAAPSRHYGITGLAHPRLTLLKTAGGNHGGLVDNYTRICLDCHSDEGPGPGISFELATKGGTALYNRHPVAISYPDGYESNAVLKPRHELPREILLVEGRISCISCHNLYSNTPGKLVASNARSGLCLFCHRI